MAAVIYLDAVFTAESPKRLCLHSVVVNPHEAGAIRDIYTKKNLSGTGSIFVNAAKLEELYCILRGLCLPHGSQVIITRMMTLSVKRRLQERIKKSGTKFRLFVMKKSIKSPTHIKA